MTDGHTNYLQEKFFVAGAKIVGDFNFRKPTCRIARKTTAIMRPEGAHFRGIKAGIVENIATDSVFTDGSVLDRFTASCAWSGLSKTLSIGMVFMIPALMLSEVRSFKANDISPPKKSNDIDSSDDTKDL